MAKRSEKENDGWRLVAMIGLIGFITCWGACSTEYIERVLHLEHLTMMSLADANTDHWLQEQAARVLKPVALDGAVLIDKLDGKVMDAWLGQRILVSVHWANLILYRGFSLVMWSLIGLPLVLAAAVDGFMVREIRKQSFVSQSPIRHMIGMNFTRAVMVVMTIWLVLPVPVPAILAPALAGLFALSLWLWAANLQKRL